MRPNMVIVRINKTSDLPNGASGNNNISLTAIILQNSKCMFALPPEMKNKPGLTKTKVDRQRMHCEGINDNGGKGLSLV